MRGFDPALEAEPFTLLIADANPELIAAVRAAVPRHWRCLAAVNARMAWHVLDEVAVPDLALIGVSLPDGDGFGLLARFPENPALSGIPVILVAGPAARNAASATKERSDSREDQLAAWRRQSFAMAADFLEWPCSAAELRTRIREPLAIRLLRRQLASADQRLAEQSRRQAEQSAAAHAAAIAALAGLSIQPPGKADGSRIERLTGLCRLLATRMAGITAFRQDITPAYLTAFCQAIPLHDIGMLACPGTAACTGTQVHTDAGARILERVREAHPESLFLMLACELAGAHHENWDGSGHPHGLSGCGIPLSARIMSIADAYDALRSGRGQPFLPHAQAVARLAADARQRFDPRILDCFIFYEQDFAAFSAEYHLDLPPEPTKQPAAAPEKKAPGPSRDPVPGERAVSASADARPAEPAHPAGIAQGAGAYRPGL